MRYVSESLEILVSHGGSSSARSFEPGAPWCSAATGFKLCYFADDDATPLENKFTSYLRSYQKQEKSERYCELKINIWDDESLGGNLHSYRPSACCIQEAGATDQTDDALQEIQLPVVKQYHLFLTNDTRAVSAFTLFVGR